MKIKVLLISCLITIWSINICDSQEKIAQALYEDKLIFSVVENLMFLQSNSQENGKIHLNNSNLNITGINLEYQIFKNISFCFAYEALLANTIIGEYFERGIGDNSRILSFENLRLNAKYLFPCSKKAVISFGLGESYVHTSMEPVIRQTQGNAYSDYSSIYLMTGIRYHFNNKRVSIGLNSNYDFFSEPNYIRSGVFEYPIKINPISLEFLLSFDL